MISDLRQSLDRLERESRKHSYTSEKIASIRISILREYLKREQERLRYEHGAGATGRGIVQQWTAVVDSLITELYRMLLSTIRGFRECPSWRSVGSGLRR